MYYYEVIVEHPLANQTLTYTSTARIQRGVRVRVELNRKKVTGMIESVRSTLPDYVCKPILDILDEAPILNEEMFELSQWLSYQTICEKISAISAMLPPVNKVSSKTTKPSTQRWVEFVHDIFDQKTTSKQKDVVLILKLKQRMLYSEFLSEFKTVGLTCIKKGFAQVKTEEIRYKPNPEQFQSAFLTLTPDQQKVKSSIVPNCHDTYLLYGATGSGKTEIYMHLAQDALKQGKDVLVLVPEISLTPQMISRFTERFGDQVVIYHSHLNPQQRYQQYKRVVDKEVSLAIGTRSAVFLPFEHLGCIILDEEHDTSYKQESVPFYHARDVAIKRGEYHQCPVILASATPSLESFARGKKGVYKLLSLPKRMASFPISTKVVDTREALRNKQSGYLSEVLLDAIDVRLKRNEQIILLLNRRGYHPTLFCELCLKVAMCPHCDVSLAYHKENQRIMCHICGYSTQKLTCVHCGHQRFNGRGVATQRLEEQLNQLFPEASILRMDADTTRIKGSHQEILEKFTTHQADILLGTQMIAKGLDVGNVTLVGIINADAAIMQPDYRSVEHAFNMMVQAAGRSGRKDLAGEVVIQVFDVNHYAVQLAARNDYETFFYKEMKYRHIGKYPPYQYLISFVTSSLNDADAYELAMDIKQIFTQKQMRVIGVASLGKNKAKFRYRVILKGQDLSSMIEFTWNYIIPLKYKSKKALLSINVNPMGLM
ncbi:MAG TPA: primosomal protein N' [Erysipelotrichaceae bacterium]|nr:primosomal protein N' [Erysipelotrichaceae bacterium]